MRTSLLLAIGLLNGCGQQQTAAPIEDAQPLAPQKIASDHLPNAYQVHPKVISGGLPEGDLAFAELAARGVQTIISVDGAAPDLQLARKHGLRYVHLPHGYDGISRGHAAALAKAVRDLPGPIYIHCHHGKHRSPTAAAVACVAAGMLDPTYAETVLKLAGTSEHYRGLYQSARSVRRLDAALLDKLPAAFPEQATVPPLAEAMVALEHTHDSLKRLAGTGWRVPPDHPDIDPAHEALLLREHFTELLRLDSVQAESAEFRRHLTDSEAAARQLESDLRGRARQDALADSLGKISTACTACHQQFRDVPLGEKRR